MDRCKGARVVSYDTLSAPLMISASESVCSKSVAESIPVSSLLSLLLRKSETNIEKEHFMNVIFLQMRAKKHTIDSISSKMHAIGPKTLPLNPSPFCCVHVTCYVTGTCVLCEVSIQRLGSLPWIWSEPLARWCADDRRKVTFPDR